PAALPAFPTAALPIFAANLSLMYTELPFLARFAAAARDGFRAVEYLFPYAYPAQELAQALNQHGLQQVLFNAPPGGRTVQDMARDRKSTRLNSSHVKN